MIVDWAVGEETTSRILAELPYPRPDIVDRPGVYPPSVDSALLSRQVIRELGAQPDRTVVELCAGSGIASIYAALAGAVVCAVDDRAEAVRAVAANAARNGVDVGAVQADVRVWTPMQPVDLLVANPPYVPAPHDTVDGHAWDAGPEGRAVLDVIVDRAPEILSAEGVLLLVFSDIAGVAEVFDRLATNGLTGSVVDEARLEFGPVTRGRADWLTEKGLIEPGQTDERIVVVRAVRSAAV
jgi:release factor glutamine methyltransferase